MKRKSEKSSRHKKKRKYSSSSSSTSTTSSSSSSSSDSDSLSSHSENDFKRRKMRKKSRRSSTSSSSEEEIKKKRLKKKRLKKKPKHNKPEQKEVKVEEKKEDEVEQSVDIPLSLMSKPMAPMTKEQWDKQQSVVRKVYDESTGRLRLIKGDGEVIEEIVSKDRHKAINQQATRGDGNYFQQNRRLCCELANIYAHCCADIRTLFPTRFQNKMLSTVSGLFENYGWFVLGCGVVVAFCLKKLQPKIAALKKRMEDDAYAAKYHKNPDLVSARLSAQIAHIKKMQEEYNKAATANKLKMEEKEKKRREEFLEKQNESSCGSKLGFKSDYNPLMGDTSRGYRASKKSQCGGGGCGK